MPRAPLPPELVEFLRRPNPAVIATVRPDGSPHAVPTWYELDDDGRILVNMDESRARLEHMRHDPRIALTVLDGDNWYSHVLVRGRVTDIRLDPDLADIDRLAQRYAGRAHRDRGRKSITALVEPETWFVWGELSSAG
jgi:PPOX class probable F420-dependent enzyme